MINAIQIKLLLAILAALVVTAVLLRKGGDTVPVTPADRQLQEKLARKVQPSSKRYLVP